MTPPTHLGLFHPAGRLSTVLNPLTGIGETESKRIIKQRDTGVPTRTPTNTYRIYTHYVIFFFFGGDRFNSCRTTSFSLGPVQDPYRQKTKPGIKGEITFTVSHPLVAWSRTPHDRAGALTAETKVLKLLVRTSRPTEVRTVHLAFYGHRTSFRVSHTLPTHTHEPIRTGEL